MELHLALKQIIDTEGKSVLKEQRLINILSDLQAYESIPASKFIITSMINHDYMSEILKISKWGVESNQLKNSFVKSTGFNEHYVDIIWNSFAYSLGYIDIFDNNSETKIVSTTQDLSNSNKMKRFFQFKYDKNINNMVDEMCSNGFVVKNRQGDFEITMEGILCDELCEINAYSNLETHSTSMINIKFNLIYDVETQFENILSYFIKEYGEPNESSGILPLTSFFDVDGVSIILSKSYEKDDEIFAIFNFEESSKDRIEANSSDSYGVKRLLNFINDSDINNLVEDLEKNGFIVNEKHGNETATLWGKLDDYFCEITVVANPEQQQMIIFAINYDKDFDLDKQFKEIKSFFTQEFGPSNDLLPTIASFSSPGVSQILLSLNSENDGVLALFNIDDNKNMLLNESSDIFSTITHLKFLDLEIDGHIENFAEHLSTKGFVQTLVLYRNITLEGTFAGVDNCTIIIMGTELTKTIWGIVVSFPPQIYWSSLKQDYLKFKKVLSMKYLYVGCKEEFIYPYFEGDGQEEIALKSKKCEYESNFKAEGGEVALIITDDMKVQILYVDYINANLKDNESVSVSYNDL